MIKICDLGVVDYHEAWRLQQQAVAQVFADRDQQILFLCEHPPVLTLGRLADRRHILYSQQQIAAAGMMVVESDRGGEVTLHAPGQLVAYPILNLEKHGRDLHRYLRTLEETGIDFLKCFDIDAERMRGKTGVWSEGQKLVSIGIGVKKWISFHGMAINVNTQLSLFDAIRPCGLDVVMTSVARIRGGEIAMSEAKKYFLNVFQKRFAI